MPPRSIAFNFCNNNLISKKPLRIVLLFALLMTALPSFGADLSVQYELVARSGVTPVPDGTGTFTSFSGAPAIDDDGNVVLVAGGDADNSGNPQGGVYTFINSSYQTVADFNTPVPNGGGALFTAFYWDDTDIDGGRVAFRADTLPGFP